MFESLRNLKYFDISHNNLREWAPPYDVVFSELQYLSLSSNTLSSFKRSSFQQMHALVYLDLSDNKIDKFDSEEYFNNSIGPIELLDLTGNNLYLVNKLSFIGFTNVTEIKVDNFASCCFIENCSATIPKSQFLTCGQLLPNQIQRVIMWVLGLFTVVSNIGVLYYRCIHRRDNKVQGLFIFNLSLSDILMGIYMVIIASADRYYRDSFPSELWRHSITCKIAGTLSVLSSEASVCFVTLISVDRLMGIRFTFSNFRNGTSSAKVVVVMLWTITIAIGVVLTVMPSVDPEFYDISEVCTGLPLSRNSVFNQRTIRESFKDKIQGVLDRNIFFNLTYDVIIDTKPGMYAGIAVFTAFNLLCFVIVAVCYIGIFLTAVKSMKKSGRGRDEKQERKMAVKMGAIVLTDLLCWLPIILLSILVQSGRFIVTPNIYTWIVTFILPINSALNPFLYTLATVISDLIEKHKDQDVQKQTGHGSYNGKSATCQ